MTRKTKASTRRYLCAGLICSAILMVTGLVIGLLDACIFEWDERLMGVITLFYVVSFVFVTFFFWRICHYDFQRWLEERKIQ